MHPMCVMTDSAGPARRLALSCSTGRPNEDGKAVNRIWERINRNKERKWKRMWRNDPLPNPA